MSTIPLRFDIKGLDDLISPQPQLDQSDAANHTWTAAIQGPDGCGKSLLGLHLASHYWHSHRTSSTPRPSIIYVSTDLSFHQANSQWEGFGLDQPALRNEQITGHYLLHRERTQIRPGTRTSDVTLQPLDPVAESPDGSILTVDDFCTEPVRNSVWFVDLQASTAGDDWGWINHFISIMPTTNPRSARHLLIVDAIEGLQTRVGNRDGYGSRRSRRSRVAQLIRNAARKGVHLVFIVEEPRQDARLPENFVADLVIRLRQRTITGYSQRTIEIEKCRGIAHVRGEHELSIRSGRGAFTGEFQHLDDPQILWSLENNPERKRYLAHIHVTPSLHCHSRDIREDKTRIPELGGSPGFGLDRLDKCFRGTSEKASLTLVLGDAGTHKGRLSRRFLAEGVVFDSQLGSVNRLASGISILLTTRILDKPRLLENMLSHFKVRPQESDMEWISSRVLCQRLGSRHLTSASLVEIILTHIRHAQQLLADASTTQEIALAPTVERQRNGHRIRFVLEDWSTLVSSHRALSEDPLLLHTLTTLLRREGVKSLIVSTESGNDGDSVLSVRNSSDLRNIDECQILTWKVSFFGQRRTAITVIPNVNDRERATIYELVPGLSDDGVFIDAHFETYCDVDVGHPRRVPLVVRLYLGNHHYDKKPSSSDHFSQALQDSLSQVFAAPDLSKEVVQFSSFSDYDRVFTLATDLSDSRLDHTLILQVDEFWSGRSQSSAAFAPLMDFWAGEAVCDDASMNAFESKWLYAHAYTRHSDVSSPVRHRTAPTSDFKKACWTGEKSPFDVRSRDEYVCVERDRSVPIPRITSRPDYTSEPCRRAFFIPWRDTDSSIDRIPYTWDFGLVVADAALWRRYEAESIATLTPGRATKVTVGDIWDELCLHRNRLTTDEVLWRAKMKQHAPDWPTFLSACRLIGTRERIPPFDFDLSTAETLTCLVLEIWASIQDGIASQLPEVSMQSAAMWPIRTNVNHPASWSLRDLALSFPHSLYLALSHLVATCVHLESSRRVVSRKESRGNVVASREWYHTATALIHDMDSKSLALLQLPGNWATRGDWALAVATGSRSKLLAHQAIDLLSSRRMNLLRLQDGIGLPVRDILPDSQICELPSAIYSNNVDTKTESAVTYGEICYLGANSDNSDFDWLWRSRIRNFDRDSFYFRRWIARMFEERDWMDNEFLNGQKSLNVFGECLAWESSVTERRGEEPRSQPAFSDVHSSKIGGNFISRFQELHKILVSALRDDKLWNPLSLD